MLLAGYLKAAGWSRTQIKTMGNINQWIRSHHSDTSAAHAAVEAGLDIVDFAAIPVENILTHTRVLSMQDPTIFNARFYWPSTQPADPEPISVFVRPGFIDNPANARGRLEDFLREVHLDLDSI